MIFSNLQKGSKVILGAKWLYPCNTAVHTIVVQCSPDDGPMNINICQLVAFEVILYSFVTLWINARLALGVIGRPLLGRVTMVLNFLHLYTISLTVD